MRRRSFLVGAAASVAAVACGRGHRPYTEPAIAGPGPYGPLLPPDRNGVRLPAGFRSRVVATAGEAVPGPTGYRWHVDPDGGAVFPRADGGWVYTSNQETTPGGAGALRFDSEGRLVDGYPILSGTRNNCAGGSTPWGTWLSCEETGSGQVYECDVGGPGQGRRRPALGAFQHEAVAVDVARHRLYLTEDESDGRLYRFTPSRWSADGAGVLDDGELAAAHVEGDLLSGSGPWTVTWLPTSVDEADRAPTTTAFDGGEGIWWDRGSVYFATKGDDRVWVLDTERDELWLVYDDDLLEDPPLRGVDNVTVSPSGDLFVAEDGGNMELVVLAVVDGKRHVAPFLRIEGHDDSEITGPAFHPAGDRLLLSSQRGPDDGPDGMTFEVTGPFVGAQRLDQ